MRRSFLNIPPGDLTPSLETIEFQDGKFYDALLNVVHDIRAKGNFSTEGLRKSKLAEVIFKYTGIRFKMIVDDSPEINAGVNIIWLEKNNILSQNDQPSEYLKDMDEHSLTTIAKRYKTDLVGEIDLANSRVGGIYSQLTFLGFITSAMLSHRSTNQYTAEETIVEGLLHEIGHIYTYIVYMAYGIKRAIILSQIARVAAGIDNYSDRVHVLQLATELGCTRLDPKALASNNPGASAVNYQVILLTESRQELKAELGLDLYSYRAAEQLADQFAVRHGAGGAMAMFTGDKWSLGKDIDAYRATLLSEALHALKLTVTIIGIPILVMTTILFTEPAAMRYDDPIDRLSLIRRELYLRVRDQKIPLLIRQRTLRDIEVIDDLLDGARRYPSLVAWLARIKPSIREYRGQMALQRTLNELGASRAFAVAGMYASMESDVYGAPAAGKSNAAALAGVLSRVSARYRTSQGGAGSLNQEALSRLMSRESEVRKLLPATGKLLLEKATTARASSPDSILNACQTELTNIQIRESVQKEILSSSDSLMAYFFTTGDYLNDVELNQLRQGNSLTELVHDVESATLKAGIYSRVASTIAKAAPAFMETLKTIAESGSVALYEDPDAEISRMTDQLRYIVTQANPLETPANPDLDDVGDACGGPYPARILEEIKNMSFGKNRLVTIDAERFRGLSGVSAPATSLIETANIARQCLAVIGQQAVPIIESLNTAPLSPVNATETVLFYTRVAHLISTLVELSEMGDAMMSDIRTMAKAIDDAQEFTVKLSQLIYPQ